MRLPLLFALGLAAYSCKTTGNINSRLSAENGASSEFPRIGFESKPAYIPKDVVVLTFDDSPDYTNTEKVLNVLREKNVKASFFINGNAWSDLAADVQMQELVKRMVNDGHELANHTFSHGHLGSMKADEVEAEIKKLEDITVKILGPSKGKMTMIRAPFGEPFQLYEQNPNGSKAEFDTVAPAMAKHGVHVGWHMDSFDYACNAGDAECVFQNVAKLLPGPGKGEHGILLMHSVHARTAAALPRIIDDLRAKGYKFWMVEDVIRACYGKTSGELMKSNEFVKSKCVTEAKASTPGTCNVPVWQAGHSYSAGDKVSYQNKVYFAEHANPGFDPIISTWYWELDQTCN